MVEASPQIEQTKAQPAPTKPTLEIAPCDTVHEDGAEVDVSIRINVPEGAPDARLPTDIVLLIDVSGSMSQSAVNENVQNGMKDEGYNILDIVKHACNAVMHMVGENDRIAAIAFHDCSDLIFPLTFMNDKQREQSIATLASYPTKGCTNMWAGIHAAMELLRKDTLGGARKKSVLLLTDGVPNVNPPEPYAKALRNYHDQHPKFKFQMNTFGFGYHLKSDLLLELAQECNGTFAFIPVAPNVGTVFVNTVSNVLTNFTQRSTLMLQPTHGAEFTGKVKGDHLTSDETWGKYVTLGPLQQGQARDIIVPMKIPAGQAPYLEATLVYPHDLNGKEVKIASTGEVREATVESKIGEVRSRMVSIGYSNVEAALKGNIQECNDQMAALEKHVDEIAEAIGSPEEFKGLVNDTKGRMAKAFDGMDRFRRWGGHYIRALMRSHQLQQNTNFMDPGLQSYGGANFRYFKERGSEVFLGLQMPRPSRPVYSYSRPVTPSYSASASGPPTQPVDNDCYYGGGGCFGPTSTVVISDQTVPVTEVRAGDKIMVADGLATVKCVVCISRPNKSLMQLPGGLTITKRHPIRVNGAWMKPCEVEDATEVSNPEGVVYNFILDRSHVPLVSGVECVTWGHGLSEEGVSHEYYGSEAVISDIMKMPGFKDGFVKVFGCTKSSKTGETNGLLINPPEITV